MLLIFRFGSPRVDILSNIIGIASLVFFALPVLQALRVSKNLNKEFDGAFQVVALEKSYPFSFSKIITGINAKQIVPQTIMYNSNDSLTLDFYPNQIGQKRPCIIVIHGGSWAGGTKEQLPELNSFLAKSGYNVVTINYRLAPQHLFPSPIVDVDVAIKYLQANADSLHVDAANIVLLGRSAGAQIALIAAYGLKEPAIKGVISYYGPTDMVWGYSFPANPLVLDSKKIMEDYLGGTYKQVPKQYELSSAAYVVNNHSVPTLIMQGKNDPLVAYEHCNRMDRKLSEFRVKHFVLRMPWATHGCDFSLNGPGGQLTTYTTMRFLKAVLH
ncbi:MAG: alpha/beta hydrolase [Flavitalea sp.]